MEILDFIPTSACIWGIHVCLCIYEFMYFDMYMGICLRTYSCIRKYLFLKDSSIHCIEPCAAQLMLIILWIYRLSHLVVMYSRQRSYVFINWLYPSVLIDCVLTCWYVSQLCINTSICIIIPKIWCIIISYEYIVLVSVCSILVAFKNKYSAPPFNSIKSLLTL